MHHKRGSTIALVMVTTLAIGIIVAGVATLVTTQRRLMIRRELQLHANNAAENALNYAFSVISTDIRAKTINTSAYIPASGFLTLTMPTEAATFITGAEAKPPGFTGNVTPLTFKDIEVRVLAKQTTIRYFVDPSDPANAADPNPNKWVFEDVVPVVAKVTSKIGLAEYTSYVQKSVTLRRVPMFQDALLSSSGGGPHRGGTFILHRSYPILGSIHANGNMIINAHDSDFARYTGYISAAKKFYRGSPIDVGGSGADPYCNVPVDSNGFIDFAGSYAEAIVLKPTGANSIEILTDYDPVTTVATYAKLGSTFDSRMANWEDNAVNTFKGHLKDQAHGIQAVTPTGVSDYCHDVPGTAGTNEFNNGPYRLIQPLLPVGHANRPADITNVLEAKATLVFKVEKLVGGTATNPVEDFRVKAYKHHPNHPDSFTEIPLPPRVIGKTDLVANPTTWEVAKAGDGQFENYAASGDTTVSSGFHDVRLGRGVQPVTLDMMRLKMVLECQPDASDLDMTAFCWVGATAGEKTAVKAQVVAFRNAISIPHAAVSGSGVDWNGLVYFEFPTSITANSGTVNDPVASFGAGASAIADKTNPYQFGTAELRHPDRWANTDNEARANRSDGIVPLAPELRQYPSSFTNADLRNVSYAIPALQIVNAKALPAPGGKDTFSIATNAPVYLVGSYNADGDYATGTKITSTLPDAYAEADPDADTSMSGTQPELSAGIFCDSLTVLSNKWITFNSRTAGANKTFDGSNNSSAAQRKVPSSGGGSGRLEISACIVTGEYPVFEFFIHALEDWNNYYNKDSGKNPVIFKGSLILGFHSELQHIKQAYGRDKTKDIQVYYHAHGAYAIPAVRFHKWLVEGRFPIGTPEAPSFTQKHFRLLRGNNAQDAAILTAAGW